MRFDFVPTLFKYALLCVLFFSHFSIFTITGRISRVQTCHTLEAYFSNSKNLNLEGIVGANFTERIMEEICQTGVSR